METPRTEDMILHDIREKADKVIRQKEEIRRLQHEMKETTFEIIKDLVDMKAVDYLSINWSRLNWMLSRQGR